MGTLVFSIHGNNNNRINKPYFFFLLLGNETLLKALQIVFLLKHVRGVISDSLSSKSFSF